MTATARPRIGVIVCCHNEEGYLPGCLYSVLGQKRRADEILVVDNASTDRTGEVAQRFAGVRVVAEPRKGLVRARERGRRETTSDLLAFLDADSRAPADWLARIEEAFGSRPDLVATTGRFRYYDWDPASRALVAAYDLLVAPPVHWLLQDVLGWGAILYGGGFCVRRSALAAIGGFDTSIDFHGEDTNLGRRLAAVGRVTLARRFWVHTSARRYRAMGRRAVFRIYLRNFWSEILHHRPRDLQHWDLH